MCSFSRKMREKTRIELVEINGKFSSTNGCWDFIVVKSHTLHFYSSTLLLWGIRHAILLFALQTSQYLTTSVT